MLTRVTPDTRVYAFARGLAPAATLDPGASAVFETNDCYDGQVDLAPAELSTASVQPGRGNPATGPVFIRGADPGDTLVAHLERVDVAPRGVLFGSDRNGDRHPGCPVDIVEGVAHLPGGVEWHVDPVVGVVGVAPAGDPVPSITPGLHGGNLDTTDIKAGCSVFLPVAEPGALFALGDIHALQGDGEVCGQGVEVAGEVAVRFEILKQRVSLGPVLKTPGHWAVLASARTLDGAVEEAILRARDFIIARLGVQDHEAIMLMSTLCDVRISQIVNPLQTARVCIPRTLIGG